MRTWYEALYTAVYNADNDIRAAIREGGVKGLDKVVLKAPRVLRGYWGKLVPVEHARKVRSLTFSFVTYESHTFYNIGVDYEGEATQELRDYIAERCDDVIFDELGLVEARLQY